MRSWLFIIGLFASVHVEGQPTYKYTVEKVTDDVFVLKPDINPYRWVTANITVIINTEDVLVVDSGLLPEAAETAIKEILKLTSKPVRYLVNTHWHGDHWQGNQVFARTYPGLEIIATDRGAEAMRRNGVMWITTFYPRYLKAMADGYEENIKKGQTDDGKPINASELSVIKKGKDEVLQDIQAMEKVKPTFPTIAFSDRMTLMRGGRTFEFYYFGIGNTIGDAVLYLPQEKVLIPGDLVVYPSPYESGAFSPEWVETSRKLRTLDFKYLIPGHGDVQNSPDYLDYLNELFAEVVRQMDAAYRAGKSNPAEVSSVVSHQSVVGELGKNPRFKPFADKLDPGFVPAAVRDGYRRIIMGVH